MDRIWRGLVDETSDGYKVTAWSEEPGEILYAIPIVLVILALVLQVMLPYLILPILLGTIPRKAKDPLDCANKVVKANQWGTLAVSLILLIGTAAMVFSSASPDLKFTVFWVILTHVMMCGTYIWVLFRLTNLRVKQITEGQDEKCFDPVMKEYRKIWLYWLLSCLITFGLFQI